MINADVNVRNWLAKGGVIKDLFGIVVIVNKTEKLCDVGEYLNYENCKCRKSWLINYLENVVKILMEIKWFIMWLYTIMKEYTIIVQYK